MGDAQRRSGVTRRHARPYFHVVTTTVGALVSDPDCAELDRMLARVLAGWLPSDRVEADSAALSSGFCNVAAWALRPRLLLRPAAGGGAEVTSDHCRAGEAGSAFV